MGSNDFKTYFVQNGKWTPGYHNWATGFGSMIIGSSYCKAFQKAAPIWLYHFELLDHRSVFRQ